MHGHITALQLAPSIFNKNFAFMEGKGFFAANALNKKALLSAAENRA